MAVLLFLGLLALPALALAQVATPTTGYDWELHRADSTQAATGILATVTNTWGPLASIIAGTVLALLLGWFLRTRVALQNNQAARRFFIPAGKLVLGAVWAALSGLSTMSHTGHALVDIAFNLVGLLVPGGLAIGLYSAQKNMGQGAAAAAGAPPAALPGPGNGPKATGADG